MEKAGHNHKNIKTLRFSYLYVAVMSCGDMVGNFPFTVFHLHFSIRLFPSSFCLPPPRLPTRIHCFARRIKSFSYIKKHSHSHTRNVLRGQQSLKVFVFITNVKFSFVTYVQVFSKKKLENKLPPPHPTPLLTKRGR